MSVENTHIVIHNFTALMHDADFTQELALLGVGRFAFLKRRQMLLELRGIYAALWYLCLRRSFPDTAQDIFQQFVAQHAKEYPDRANHLLRQRWFEYKEMLSPTGDSNFLLVSRHLLSFTVRNEATAKALGLRLALLLRTKYTFIYDRLI